jgi:tetratricopeptide (TPR) repeat protein
LKAGELLFRAELALRLRQPDYTIAACRQVLESLPGHLRAQSLLGQGLLEKGHLAEAAEAFRQVLELDPENVVARSGLAVIKEEEGQLKEAITEMEKAWAADPASQELKEALITLRAKLDREGKAAELPAAGWGRLYARRGEHAKALHAYQQGLSGGHKGPEVRLAQAESLWHLGRPEEAARICQDLISEAPQAVKAKLLLGLIRLQRGDLAGGTALLHEAMSADPSASVAAPLLGATHFGLPKLEDSVDISSPSLPLPPEVEAALAAGVSLTGQEEQEKGTAPPPEEEPDEGMEAAREFQAALYALSEQLAPTAGKRSQKEPTLGTYHIVLPRAALVRKYGEGAYLTIERKLKALQEALGQAGYLAHLLPIDASGEGGAAEVTEMIRDRLQEMSGAERLEGPLDHVLLVGGDDLVPFHRLTNPTEDDDPLLLSDAPYAAAQNLFVYRRAVGRLPDGAGGDPRFLLSLLDSMIASYVNPPRGSGFRPGLLGLLPGRQGSRLGKSFGYTALVWRSASEALYELIGGPTSVQVSPPMTNKGLESGWMDRARFLLFNLHGTLESCYWYGQKDATYPLEYPLFPIALGPENLSEVDLTGAIVFTEACYGAHILDKSPEDALALHFLRRGAACVVGANHIAYGASEPPLTGADLLARYFWLYLESGLSAGEALARARSKFVQEAQARQGYVDGDDQKTALEFVLLGDPAARLLTAQDRTSLEASPVGVAESFQPRLFCKRMSAEGGVRMEGETLAKARNHLKRVAPETWDTQLSVLPRYCCASGRFFECQGECHHKEPIQMDSYLITARKSLNTQDGTTLHRVARLTLDRDGRVLKVSLSK